MIILGGDFNCPEVDWVSGSLVDSYVTETFRKSLITLAHNSMLEQIVTQPTRGNNILDLALVILNMRGKYNRANWNVIRDEISVVSDMYFNFNENNTAELWNKTETVFMRTFC